MLKRWINFFIFLLIFINFSFGEDLIIESNYPLPRNNLKDIYKETKDINLIKKILENSGDYEKIRVVSKNKIEVKRKLILKRVHTRGNLSAWRKDILSSAGLIENYPITVEDIYTIPIRVKQFYAEKGFPFVQIEMKTKIDNKNGTVEIWLNIDENYQYEVEDINIISDRELPKKLIDKLKDISELEEEKFSYSKLDDAIDNIENYLKKLGYYDNVVYFLSLEKIKTYPKPFSFIFKNPLKVNLFIDTGTKYIIEFKGADNKEKKEFLNFVNFADEGFSKYLLEELKDKIENYYRGRNYFDVKVSYKIDKNLEDNKILVRFNIEKGNRYTLKGFSLDTDIKEVKDFFSKIDKSRITLLEINNFLKNLEKKLLKEGYFNEKLDIKVEKNKIKKAFSVKISFFKYKRDILEKIVIKNIPKYELDIDVPKVYNPTELQNLLILLKEHIKEKGYIKGDVLLNTYVSKEDKNTRYITAVYTGVLGEKYKRYEPSVYGTFHLSPKYVVKNLYEDSEKPFSPELEDNNTNYLYETYLFNSVSSYNFVDEKNKKVLESYYLREDKRGFFQASIGYNTEEELKLTGLLTLKNMFNIGLEATGYINFSSKRVLSRVSLGSRLFPYKISAFANFYKDYQYHRYFDKDIEGYGIYGERYINKWVKRRLRIERNYIQVKNADLSLGRYKRYFITKVRYTIIDNHRNSRIFPTSGYYFNGSLTKYFEDLTYFKVDTYFRYYFPLYKRKLIWTQALNMGYIWEDIENIPVSERYFIGRPEGFRGFGFERLGGLKGQGGKDFFVLNNELRFPLLSEAIYGFVFVDVGNVFERDKDLKAFKTRETGGFGVMIPTPAGAILLDIAKKLDRLKGESPYRFELNIELRF